MSDQGERIYKIPEGRMWEFKAKVAELAKRAEKLGLPEIGFKVMDVTKEKRHVGEGEGKLIDVVINHVAVFGTAPKINGWRLVGTLMHTEEGNLALAVAGFTLPEKYRGAAPGCDHCGVNRRRNDTFVVLHEGGDYKQVGSTCLKDFLGHKDPAAIAALCERMVQFNQECEDFDDGWLSGRRQRESVHFEDFMVALARTVRQRGFVSGKEAFEQHSTATGKLVWMDITTPADDLTETDRKRATPTDEDKALGKKWAEWATTTYAEKEPASDFEHNLRLTVRLGLVVERTANIAASIYTMYARAQREALEDKWKGVISEHVGEIGKRAEFVLTCVGVFQHEGDYGITNITRFRDEKGNVLVWFQAGTKEYRGYNKDPELKAKKALEEGKSYRIRGTPKKHDERRGEKQTILSRVEVVPDDAPPMKEAKPRKPRQKKPSPALVAAVEASVAAVEQKAAMDAAHQPDDRADRHDGPMEA